MVSAIYRAALTLGTLLVLAPVAMAQGNRGGSTTAAAASGAVKVNDFLSYNPSTKTATLQLVSGFDGTNGGLNFNGGGKGSHTLIMPAGWTVKANFVNRDGNLPHSAIVIDMVSPIPAMPPEPGLARAYTIKLEEGLSAGQADEMTFKTSEPGKYLIFCGVPGHGVRGMWINLDVSGSAKQPAYKM